jgi:hypothetical protein
VSSLSFDLGQLLWNWPLGRSAIIPAGCSLTNQNFADFHNDHAAYLIIPRALGYDHKPAITPMLQPMYATSTMIVNVKPPLHYRRW